jgi:hypothetical protein
MGDRLSYTHLVKLNLMILALAVGVASPAAAQLPERISVMLDVRTEGRATRDEAANRLLGDVQRGLDAIGDVDVVPREHARRTPAPIEVETRIELFAEFIASCGRGRKCERQ